MSYDLTFMKQKSWGRGRKLEHRFEVTVDGVPDGKAQEVLVNLVDESLKLDGSLGRFFGRPFAVAATLPSRIEQRAIVVVQFEVERVEPTVRPAVPAPR